MSYWYAQRKGVHFSALWLGYGNYPADYDPVYVQQILNEASSIYFVNLVIMRTWSHSLFVLIPNNRKQNGLT